jgi:transcriptional regulator with GAF, ATPase, and Fis domain
VTSCQRCAGLELRIAALESALARRDHWPVWLVELTAGVKAVQEAAFRLGVDARKVFNPALNTQNQERDRVIKDLRCQGWTVSQLARIFGITERTVKRAGKRTRGVTTSHK